MRQPQKAVPILTQRLSCISVSSHVPFDSHFQHGLVASRPLLSQAPLHCPNWVGPCPTHTPCSHVARCYPFAMRSSAQTNLARDGQLNPELCTTTFALPHMSEVTWPCIASNANAQRVGYAHRMGSATEDGPHELGCVEHSRSPGEIARCPLQLHSVPE